MIDFQFFFSGSAWSNFERLEEKFPGIKKTFEKLKQRKHLDPEDTLPLIDLAKKSVTCTLSPQKLMEDFGYDYETALKIVKSAKEVNTHHHTKTCKKKVQVGCRFKMPRLPSLHTIIAQVLLQGDMKEEDFGNLQRGIFYVKKMVKEELEMLIEKEVDLSTVDLDKLLLDSLPDISCDNDNIIVTGPIAAYKFDVGIVNNFYKQYTKTKVTAVSSQKFLRLALYHYCLSICDYGTSVILERTVEEVFINNYNPVWMDCWDGNMDVSLCTDYFAIITYMTDYIVKPETKTADILKAVHKEKKKEKASHREIMHSLVNAYLQSRELGECEGYYKLDPNLHFKESNIKTIFVTSGFPKNRYSFLRKLSDDANNEYAFEVDGFEGQFIATETIHVKYSLRPDVVFVMVLAQFVIWYTLMSPLAAAQAKKRHGENLLKMMSDEKIVVSTDYLDKPPKENPDLLMPEFIQLANGKLFRKRKYPAVLRRHKFKGKNKEETHEFFYSELLLFYPWQDEAELFEDDGAKCKALYIKKDDFPETMTTEEGKEIELTKIDIVKRKLFPHLKDVEQGREMVSKFDFDKASIGQEINPEGEKQDEEDEEIGTEDAEEFAGLNPDGLDEPRDNNHSGGDYNIRIPEPIDYDALLGDTRKLVSEQQTVLGIVVEYCKELQKSKKHPTNFKPPKLIIHGGAGTGKSHLIKIISQWVQHLLTGAGDDCDTPYIIRTAPTGMAAANIEGSTIHTAFNLFGINLMQLSDQKRDLFRENFKNIEFCIIDEFSMMKADQLYQIHERLCEVKQCDLPFGGVCVLLFGDVMQLRPIQGVWSFEKPRNEKYGKVSEIYSLWEMFDCIELEHNHRQGPDKEYAELLDRIRFKSKADDLSDDDLALLNSRILDPGEENVTKIFGKNVNVNEENRKKLAAIKRKKFVSHAVHMPKERKVTINNDGSIEKTTFLDRLELKVGARVMLLHNINTLDGLVNGVQGEVQEIITDKDDKIRYVLVKFDNPKIGEEQRMKYKFLENNGLAHTDLSTAVPIERINFSYTLGNVSKMHGARASFMQIPLKCSWAITAHKVSKHIKLLLLNHYS